MDRFSGLFAASVTPVRHDLRCDFDALAEHCKDLLARSCQGVVLFGSTGEGPSFTLRERKEALEQVIRLGVDPAKIIVGTTFAALEDAIELANYSVLMGTLAILSAPPFYYKKVPSEGIISFYREMLKRTKAQVILYHIPQYSNAPLSFSIVERLYKEFPEAIVGMKESEGNLEFTKELLQKLPNLHLFIGNELQIFEAHALGAKGAISGLANCFPEKIASQFQKSDNSIAALRALLADFPIFPAIKNIVAQQKGARFELMRPPVMALSESEAKKLQSALERWKLS